jgi:hypothetical protein
MAAFVFVAGVIIELARFYFFSVRGIGIADDGIIL